MSSTKLSQLVEEIAQLTPTQRRQLFVRLRAAGLFVPEELLSDRHRLAVATSVKPVPDQRTNGKSNSSVTAPPTAPTKPVAQPAVPTTAATSAALPINATAEYRSPVAGRVVLAPESPTQASDQTMPPLPGQAPEQPIEIIFDGGSRGNPGQGYGSYHLHWPGSPDQTVRLRFGDKVTNNEAEYDTLIAALEVVLKRLADGHADPKTATLDVRGDSLLVVNQVLGKWEVKEDRMRIRRDEVRKLLSRFGHARLTHHGRENSVKVLGH